ncbi:hypothetical protein BJF79_38635 [Actinomadura sp. CNU-125]|nr:hypothetical protein BJF79_38635 [Actinomadura sp. CNU-125]
MTSSAASIVAASASGTARRGRVEGARAVAGFEVGDDGGAVGGAHRERVDDEAAAVAADGPGDHRGVREGRGEGVQGRGTVRAVVGGDGRRAAGRVGDLGHEPLRARLVADVEDLGDLQHADELGLDARPDEPRRQRFEGLPARLEVGDAQPRGQAVPRAAEGGDGRLGDASGGDADDPPGAAGGALGDDVGGGEGPQGRADDAASAQVAPVSRSPSGTSQRRFRTSTMPVAACAR